MQDEINGTIQLDKLTLCCESTKFVYDTFNMLRVKNIDFAETDEYFQSFGMRISEHPQPKFRIKS